MPRKKKVDVKVTKSEWNKADMPRFALAMTTVLVDTGKAGAVMNEAALENLRGVIRFDIENKLHLEVESIRLVLVEENPPTRI